MPRGRPKKIETDSDLSKQREELKKYFETALKAVENWRRSCEPGSAKMQEMEMRLTVARDKYYKFLEETAKDTKH